MNAAAFHLRRILPGLLIALFAGCATPKFDWNPRVGIYTYDQAVLDMGPPDRKEKLTDGTVVAEWLVHRGYSYGTPAYVYPVWWNGPFYPSYTVQSTPDYFL